MSCSFLLNKQVELRGVNRREYQSVVEGLSGARQPL